MRIRSDPANGDAYDPSYRASVWDYLPKHSAHEHCSPYYTTDYTADYDGPAYDPTAYFHHAVTQPNHHVNPAPYVSRSNRKPDGAVYPRS